MAKDILMPALSPSMTEGTLVKWLKKEGDTIKVNDVIAEIETDKTTMDLPAFDAGILRKVFVQEGTRVSVNTRIGIVGTKDEAIDLSEPAPAATPAPKTESAPAPKETSAPSVASSSTPALSNSRVKASPLAKKIAEEKGVSLSQLSGSGPGGRIVKKDVLSAPAGGSRGSSLYPIGPIAKESRQPLTTMRSVIAKRLLESKTTIPHFYLEIEVDAKPMIDLRTQLNDTLGKLTPPVKISFNDFVLKAAAEAVRRVPAVNASFLGDAIQQFGDVQLSFAVAIPDGLITPIIREAQNKSLVQISNEAKALALKARDGKLKPEEFQGGTFTISNLGMLGIDRFSAIVNPPQAGILAVGNILKKPVVDADDNIVVGHRQSFTLSCDHRVIDGAVGAAYLKEFRELIEKPALLLL